MTFHLLINPVTNRHKSFWQTYKNKNKRSEVKSRKELLKITDAIFKNATKAVDERNGVILEGIGYVGVWMPLVRRFEEVRRQDNILKVNHQTNYYNFIPALFTDVFRGDFFKGWSMDFSFSRDISRKVLDEVKNNGRSYPLHYTEIKNLYK